MSHKRTFAVLLMLGAAFFVAATCHAQTSTTEYGLLDPHRLSLAAQFGIDYDRPTDFSVGTATRDYAVKLVPSWNAWGKPGHSTGSIAVNTPIKYVLGGDHPLEIGAYVSIIIWSGKDLPVPAPKAQ